MRKPWFLSVFAALALLSAGPRALAATSFFCGGSTLSDGTPLPPGASFPINLCPLSNGMVSGVGMVFDHRDYLPATPLGTIPGFSFGLEVTMVHMTDSFIALLGGNPPLSFLPSVRFHFAKGIGPVDLSTSAFYLPGILMLGGAVKWTFWNKEEGPSWAARVSYAYSYFPFPPTLPGGQPLMSAPFNINFITHTITPVVMMSRKLNMGVEPYIGAGMQIAFGGFDVSIPIDPSISALLPNHQTKIEDFIPGLGLAGIGFIGLSSHIPYLGLGITIEMQYNTAGASSIGFDLGFTF